MRIEDIKVGDRLRYYASGFYSATVVSKTAKKIKVDISWQKGKLVDPANLHPGK